MRSDMSTDEKEKDRSHLRRIHIIGPQRLQNKLFAEFLAQHTDCVCDEAETFDDALKYDASGHHPELFLRDFQGIQIEDLFLELKQQKDTFVNQHYLALFNVEMTEI